MDPPRDPSAPGKALTPGAPSTTATRRVLDDVTRFINAGLHLRLPHRTPVPTLRLRPAEQTPSVRRHALFGFGSRWVRAQSRTCGANHSHARLFVVARTAYAHST